MTAIDADVTVTDVLTVYPAVARVFVAHGMQCVGCAFAPHETIAEVCRTYGLDVDSFVRQLREGKEGHHVE